jgi:hypothetical protein
MESRRIGHRQPVFAPAARRERRPRRRGVDVGEKRSAETLTILRAELAEPSQRNGQAMMSGVI